MADQHDLTYLQAMQRLRTEFEEVHSRGLREPGSAALATSDVRGQPSIRTVSVITVDDKGPLFFADSRSGKSRQLEDNPRAALCFFWPVLSRQVVIEGHAEGAAAEIADRYWARRPRESQLAAWITEDPFRHEMREGDPLGSVRRYFDSRLVPRPPHWRAIHLCPDRVVFWTLGWRNLHCRERYHRDHGGRWVFDRLSPF